MGSIADYDNLINQLTPFVRALTDSASSFENILTGFSSKLPQVEENIDDTVLGVSEMLSLFDESKVEGFNELSSQKKQIHSTLDIIKQLQASDEAAFGTIDKSISFSLSTMDQIEKVHSFSEDLRCFAINSIALSHNMGREGKGYQIISSEFIKLSNEIEQQSASINFVSQKLEKIVSEKLGTKIKSKRDDIFDANKGVVDEFQKNTKESKENVVKCRTILASMNDALQSIKTPISRVMVKLQQQDIIQQQLCHLNEFVEDILVIIKDIPFLDVEEKITEDISDVLSYEQKSLFVLLDFLMKVIKKQLERISVDINTFSSQIELEFSSMKEKLDTIQKQNDYFKSAMRLSEKGDKNYSLEDVLFKKSLSVVDSISCNVKEMIAQKKEVIETFNAILNIIGEERELSQPFLPAIDSVENLLLLARIEKATYQLEISDLDGDISSSSLADLYALEEVVNKIEEAYAQVSQNIQLLKEMIDSEQELLLEHESKVEGIETFFSNLQSSFVKNYTDVINLTNMFVAELENYFSLFSSFVELSNSLGANIEVCSDIENQVSYFINHYDIHMTLNECSFKDVIIQKIVKKCTVEQERDTLMEHYSELNIEESAGSNITLF